MKKVMLTEKANLSEEEKSKLIVRSLKAIYLATLIAFGSYATIDSINRINEAKEYITIEDYELAEIVVNENITLKIAKPDTVKKDGTTTKIAPPGYIIENGLCYKLETTGEVPDGYILAEDGKTLVRTDAFKISPEGFILVGDKAIAVADPKNKTINGYRYFTLPKGFFLVGDIGVKVFDYEKEQKLTLKPR